MPPEPLILAFDTSAAHCAVALVLGDSVLVDRTEPMAKGQAERLFPLLEEVLTEAGKNWQDIDAIGCGTGPGNFTGIRLSVSAARGLSLSLNITAIGVSALEAMLLGAAEPALAMIDARRDQIYAQVSGFDPELTTQDKLADTVQVKIKSCLGHAAQVMVETLGARNAAPIYPVAVAIAKIARSRLGTAAPRPAPLYLKSADAAPSRDAAPAILS